MASIPSASKLLPLLLAFTPSTLSYIVARGLTVPNTLPGTWISQGCYTDIGRTLTGGGYVNNTGMTEESCINYCMKLGMIYAGTEYGSECYCGMSVASAAASAPSADCSFPCSGNSTQPCGGPNRLSLFWSNTTGPQINPGNASWAFSGCYTEGSTGRTLPNAVNVVGGSANMTVDLCTTACGNAGYSLAGAEYSGECWCGNSISNGGKLAPDGLTGCNMLCNGNFSEFCGGSGRLVVYDFNNTVSLPPYSTASSMTKPSTSSSSTKSSISSTSSTSSISSTTSSSVSKSSTSTILSTSTNPSSSSTSTQITSSTLGNPTSTSSSTSSKPSSSTSNAGISSTSSSVSSAPSSSSISSPSTSSSSTTSSVKSSSSSLVSSSSSTSWPSTSSSSTTSSIKSSSSSLVSSSSSASSAAAPTPTGPIYKYVGCYTEANGGRALSSAAYAADTMTLESCQSSCAGFKYWGTEYGRECYCGNSFAAGSVPAPETDCSFPCAGNSAEKCGAGLRLSVYQLNSTISSVSSTSATGTSSAAPSSTTSATPIATGFPANWTSQGCWVDGVNGRILTNQMPDSQTLTLQSCAKTCAAAGYSIAGAEYSSQCFCGNYVYNGGVVATNQADCNTPCSGNSAQMCGGGGRLSVYSIGTPKVFQPPSAQTSGLPTGWRYSGCLEDNLPSAQDPNFILPTFPYMSQNETYNTPTSCLTLCQKYGYNAAGLEYGIQCFCGDTQNIQVASAPSAAGGYTRARVPQIVPDSQCNVACPGDGEKICGGGNRLSWYSWNGTQPLYNFNFPTGTNAGKYELLIGGVVVPLMTSQVITGKVTFVEKFGTGEPNGTGAYELDLSQINNFNSAWRTMKGFQTDVFCSAGLILPDRAGRQLNVGGWAGESNYGIRLYWPDGSAGVKGVNQWIEDPNNLQLQVPRWYPSALIMANGSVLVVGGEIGQNDLSQPTLELLPPTGVKTTTTSSGYSNTTVYLDFLQRTAPFNLYPFITVLSSGIFIAYYNEARILDEKTFQTIKVLPTIPGAVNEQDGGRSYQLEGTMVTLPQYAPFTDPVTVLICGGSTPGAGFAIDNCVSTQPEAADPQWTIERMPSRRVMPCIAALPDGTYLILNGAQHGVAGFGLAYDPNFNALLYDPSQPVNSRISVMANTTVARLYHSEAIVLLDGRVLVSGSDPQDDVNDPNFYPEEYRVEVFSPPYLLSGLPKPTFTITNKDWAYGASIQFTLTSVSSANIRVSMLGSVVSTHGNSMGQRTLFPAVSCAGNTCTITAPPNAHAAPPGWFQLFVLDGPTPSQGVFVRLGGDPANLGSWPNLPTFNGQLPGTGPV